MIVTAYVIGRVSELPRHAPLRTGVHNYHREVRAQTHTYTRTHVLVHVCSGGGRGLADLGQEVTRSMLAADVGAGRSTFIVPTSFIVLESLFLATGQSR